MRNTTHFSDGRLRDLVSIGRLAVDLYAEQIGCRLEDVASFAKYLGGSSANVAFGLARLGLKSAMISRVGNEPMGRFLLETLAREGCDISQVKVDPERLTALVLLGLRDRETFPLIFYRENCADMAFGPEDVDEAFIAGSRALHITGTHFSTERVRAGSLCALEFARKHGVRSVLDIDYRPVLWGLAARGDGETRYVPSGEVTAKLQEILPWFDLVVGTEEEFHIAGGTTDTLAALRQVRLTTPAVLVVKRGPLGCAVIEGAIPASLDAAFSVAGARVEVLNVLGAGDAFLAGFLSGWLRGADYRECCLRANACGALVVSRHACAPAMPTEAELQYFLANTQRIQAPAQDARLAHLHRVTPQRAPRDELCIFAFDHRSQFYELVRQAGADEARLPRLKRLLVDAVAATEHDLNLQGRIGVLLDGHYGEDALAAASGRGWWIGRPLELPGSYPLVFEPGRSIGTALVSWPREHVVKCLVFYHPDDAVENRIEQEAQLAALFDATRASGHELLIEVIAPAHLPQAADTVPRALKRLYNIGIQPDWWKLAPMAAAQWCEIDALIAARDPHCRGVVMLGLNAPVTELVQGFEEARASTSCRGFAVGRSIFHDAAAAWLAGAIDDASLVARCRDNFEQLIRAWQGVRADADKKREAA